MPFPGTAGVIPALVAGIRVQSAPSYVGLENSAAGVADALDPGHKARDDSVAAFTPFGTARSLPGSVAVGCPRKRQAPRTSMKPQVSEHGLDGVEIFHDLEEEERARLAAELETLNLQARRRAGAPGRDGGRALCRRHRAASPSPSKAGARRWPSWARASRSARSPSLPAARAPPPSRRCATAWCCGWGGPSSRSCRPRARRSGAR